MRSAAASLAIGALVAGGTGALGLALMATPKPERSVQRPPNGATRALHGSAALLASSVLVDSAMEHYRGAFENPGMFAPLISSALTLVAGTGAAALARPRGAGFRKGCYRLSVWVGGAGMAFHLYNLFKRPGGFGWLNLFYGAPVGAPAALSLSGSLGLAAESLSTQPLARARLWGAPAGPALAGLTAMALAGTAAEAALFHFRGAFQNPFMWAPVSLPPVAAGLMARASLERPAQTHPLTRLWLSMTLLLGFAGAGFHAFGVARAMGGWRNWSQNLIDGPPLPAPPSFSALALAGLAALSLIETSAGAQDERERS